MLGDLLREFEVRIGIELMFAHGVVRVRRTVADTEHHAVVADVEPLELHIDPLRRNLGLRIVVSPHVVGQEVAVREADFDAARLVQQKQRLEDIALAVVRNHLALDVNILIELIVFRIVPTRIAARAAQPTEFVGEDLLHLCDRTMGRTRRIDLVLCPDLRRSRIIEIIVAAGEESGRDEH